VVADGGDSTVFLLSCEQATTDALSRSRDPIDSKSVFIMNSLKVIGRDIPLSVIQQHEKLVSTLISS